MKIKTVIKVTVDFTAHGFTTLPAEKSVRLNIHGEISCPTMLQKGDEIEINHSLLSTLCNIPTRLTLTDGGRAPRIKVVEALFALDERNVAHPEIRCTLQLWTDFTKIPKYAEAQKIVAEYIVRPFEQAGFEMWSEIFKT